MPLGGGETHRLMGHFSLELPPTLDLSRLIEVLNDRLRRIAAAIEGPITLRADLDAAGHRLKDLADPRDGKDALSQHAADRRYMTAAATRELVTQTTRLVYPLPWMRRRQ